MNLHSSANWLRALMSPYIRFLQPLSHGVFKISRDWGPTPHEEEFFLYCQLYPSSCLFISDEFDSILFVISFTYWKTLIRNLFCCLFFWLTNPSCFSLSLCVVSSSHLTILVVSPGLAPVYYYFCLYGRIHSWTKYSRYSHALAD